MGKRCFYYQAVFRDADGDTWEQVILNYDLADARNRADRIAAERNVKRVEVKRLDVETGFARIQLLPEFRRMKEEV